MFEKFKSLFAAKASKPKEEEPKIVLFIDVLREYIDKYILEITLAHSKRT